MLTHQRRPLMMAANVFAPEDVTLHHLSLKRCWWDPSDVLGNRGLIPVRIELQQVLIVAGVAPAFDPLQEESHIL